MAVPSYGSSVFSTSSATTLVITRPSCFAGDLLVIQATAYLGTITTLAGWTSLIDVTHGPFTSRAYIYYKIAGSSEPSTYTFTTSNSTTHDAMCSVFSGANPTTPIDVSATAATPSNTTTPTCPTVTTTGTDRLILHFWFVVNPTSITPPGGETKHYQQTNSPGSAGGGLMVMSTLAQSIAGAAGTSVGTANPIATTNNPMASVALAPVPVSSPPVADFTGTPTTGAASLSVAFTDSSTNTPTSWAWDFGDGATSTSQNPTHSYTSSGVYTVALTATNTAGSNTKARTAYITATEPIALVTGGGIEIY